LENIIFVFYHNFTPSELNKSRKISCTNKIMTIKEFFTSRITSFGHAFRGWYHVLQTQHNAWIHSVAASAVLILGLWLGLPARDWAVLV